MLCLLHDTTIFLLARYEHRIDTQLPHDFYVFPSTYHLSEPSLRPSRQKIQVEA